MPQNFIDCDRDQTLLLPPNLKDWLPDDHLVWFVIESVKRMDLSEFYAAHRLDGWGRAAFDPQMMVTLLLYAYAVGVRSTRQIERRLVEDVAFRVISADRRVDHSTIARFSKRHEAALGDLFVDVVRLCVDAGIVSPTIVVVDGTKIAADASMARSVSDEQLKEFARRVFEEAAAIDAAEDEELGDQGYGLPPEFGDPEYRRQWIEQHLGRKKVNLTDPDSAVQRTPGGYVQGYNAQAVVTMEQIVVAADITANNNDVNEFVPMLEQTQDNLDAAGHEDDAHIALADSGYLSSANVASDIVDDKVIAPTKQRRLADALQDPDAMTPTTTPPRAQFVVDERRTDVIEAYAAHHITAQEAALSLNESVERIYWLAWAYRRWDRAGIPRTVVARPQPSQSPRLQMLKRLSEPGTLELYAKRAQTIEPVFGDTKQNRGFRRFMRRGLEACRSEWRMQMATHNLLKLWRVGGFALAPAA